MRHKISDGDFVFIAIHSESDEHAQDVVNMFQKWIKERGLQEVKVQAYKRALSNNPVFVEVHVLSVNDVFEGELLKSGGSNEAKRPEDQ